MPIYLPPLALPCDDDHNNHHNNNLCAPDVRQPSWSRFHPPPTPATIAPVHPSSSDACARDSITAARHQAYLHSRLIAHVVGIRDLRLEPHPPSAPAPLRTHPPLRSPIRLAPIDRNTSYFQRRPTTTKRKRDPDDENENTPAGNQKSEPKLKPKRIRSCTLTPTAEMALRPATPKRPRPPHIPFGLTVGDLEDAAALAGKVPPPRDRRANGPGEGGRCWAAYLAGDR